MGLYAWTSGGIDCPSSKFEEAGLLGLHQQLIIGDFVPVSILCFQVQIL